MNLHENAFNLFIYYVGPVLGQKHANNKPFHTGVY